MWEVHLAHQVATIIFLYFLLFSVSFLLAERERNRKYPRCYIQKRGSVRESLVLLHWQDRLEERAPGIVQEINTLGEFYCKDTFSQNTILAEESESEKHKCVDINTWQGVLLNTKQCWCVGSLCRHQKNQRTVLCFFSIAKFLSLDTLFLW